FAYALVFIAGVVVAASAGYAINLPVRQIRGGAAPAPLIHLAGDPGVLVEAVKLADDRSGDVIVRMYESLGGRARVRVVADFTAAAWTETDLLEDPIEPDATEGCAPGEVRLHPFQIVTLRVRPADLDS
ncbi:MAG: glycosyl hydrolase-related protein, partial [Jatrophihabitans sp.]